MNSDNFDKMMAINKYDNNLDNNNVQHDVRNNINHVHSNRNDTNDYQWKIVQMKSNKMKLS